MRATLDAYPDRVLIGELYLPIEQLVLYYGKDGKGAHLPFNFHLISTAWTAAAIGALVEEYETALPPVACPYWVLGNHYQSEYAPYSVGPTRESPRCSCSRFAARRRSTMATRLRSIGPHSRLYCLRSRRILVALPFPLLCANPDVLLLLSSRLIQQGQALSAPALRLRYPERKPHERLPSFYSHPPPPPDLTPSSALLSSRRRYVAINTTEITSYSTTARLVHLDRAQFQQQAPGKQPHSRWRSRASVNSTRS